MITANWPEIIGTLLLALGAIGSSAYAGRTVGRWYYGKHPKPTTRSADAGPPTGAVEWVVDITAAMGASHASCVLDALADGCCRDQARARRIEHLEARKWPVVPSETTTQHLATLTPQEVQT